MKISVLAGLLSALCFATPFVFHQAPQVVHQSRGREHCSVLLLLVNTSILLVLALGGRLLIILKCLLVSCNGNSFINYNKNSLLILACG